MKAEPEPVAYADKPRRTGIPFGQHKETTMIDDRKRARIEEVKALLTDFVRQHLAGAPDLAAYIGKLWDQIGRKRNYVITGGTKEVWASAVVYVIARLSFLFDRSSPHYLSHDTICGFFGTKKGTVSARAAEIEKACRIRTGQDRRPLASLS